MAALRFYLDENIPVAVAVQLIARGIETVTVRDLGALGYSDEDHLARATAMGFVLCSQDADYIEIAKSGFEHTGIVYSQMHRHGIGEWVTTLARLHTRFTSEEFFNRVEYL